MPANKRLLRKLLIVAAYIVFLFAAVEGFSYFSIHFTFLKALFYDGEVLAEDDYQSYVKLRDPVLGWPKRNTDFGQVGFIPRVSPAFGKVCFSLYGDSFTYGVEVEGEDSWGNVATDLLKCDVQNFGIGGYGTDQSYLRYLENKSFDKSPIIVLNHTSENIERNRNQYRELLYQGQLKGFKPVFVVQHGALKYVPLVGFGSYAAYAAAVFEPKSDVFKFEHYLPASKIANFRSEFPFTISLLYAVINHYRIRAKIAGEPAHAFRYRDRGDVDLTSEIIMAFVKEVERANRVPVIAVIPTCRDLEFFKDKGVFPYAPLIEIIEARRGKAPLFDFGKAMAARSDFQEFYDWYGKCSGHPNKQGYRVMAEEFVKFALMRELVD